MHNPNTEQAADPHEHLPLAERWARMRAAYRMANIASHHVLGFAVKTVLLAYEHGPKNGTAIAIERL